jgi:hypothetical protein
MNMLYYECLKEWFSDVEVLDICGGFLEKIANSLVCNMWKVDIAFRRAGTKLVPFQSKLPIYWCITTALK